MSDFPNYEALDNVVRELVEHVVTLTADYLETGDIKPVLREEATRWSGKILKAALGDMVLYRGCKHEVEDTLCDPLCEAYVRGDGMVQVWPKETTE